MHFVTGSLLASATAFGLAEAAPQGWGNWGQWGWGHHGPPHHGPPHHDPPHHEPQQPIKSGINVQLGPRPYYLVDNMDDSPLKTKLESCSEGPFETSKFSISHRGAPLMFPEHSRQGYKAAARMGASIIECDVSFTSDKELVCRHSNCDLHYTTNILAHPDLAAKCTTPFTPYDPATGTPASAKCCTSDITLKEFKSLCAEMEGTTFNAVNTTQFMGKAASTPDWRTNMYAYSCAETMSLKEQITLVDSMGLNFTAEAKLPQVAMPFQGTYTQTDFIQQIIDTFNGFKIDPARVWLQSFTPDDIFYWLKTSPAFGLQAIYLDQRPDNGTAGYAEAIASMPDLAKRGVKILSPPMYALVTADNATGEIVASNYSIEAKKNGIDLISWSAERSGPLEVMSGGYYYQSIANLIQKDGDEYKLIDALAQKVGVIKMFADWAATITYYANCFDL